MADQLNMNNLSLQESQHAPKPGQQQNGGYGQGRSAYIPPHMRGARGGPAPGPPAFDGPPPMGGPGFGPPPGAQAKYASLSSCNLAPNND
jgi:ATP-dependent RNA helicase DDX3X